MSLIFPTMTADRSVQTTVEYEAALRRINALMDAEANTPEADELSVLATLVELYEEKHFPMYLPTPVEVRV